MQPPWSEHCAATRTCQQRIGRCGIAGSEPAAHLDHLDIGETVVHEDFRPELRLPAERTCHNNKRILGAVRDFRVLEAAHTGVQSGVSDTQGLKAGLVTHRVYGLGSEQWN